MSKEYQAIRQRLEAREGGLVRRLASMPLATRRPRMTARGIARMSERMAVYSPAEIQAADSRSSAYDAIWGFSGAATLAGFVDMERIRAIPVLKSSNPVE